jgi:tRNA threonylcarbamoyladenosine biosynthesis protein TsaE
MHVSIVASRPLPAVLDTVWPHEPACAQAASGWARVLAPALKRGDSVVVNLHGTLGAGKTTFTRHLLRALGVQGRIKSPSYAVVEPHETPVGTALHFDFYRFNDPTEWEDAGFRDLFASPGLKLVEWPEKVAGLLPPADLDLYLTPPELQDGKADEADEADGAGQPRQVRAVANAAAGLALIDAWQPTLNATEASHV